MEIEKRITQILHFHSDFDEHELHKEVYTSLQDFIHDWVGYPYTHEQLCNLDLDSEEYGSEKCCFNLIKDGYHIGEWSTDELWFAVDGKLRLGLGEV